MCGWSPLGGSDVRQAFKCETVLCLLVTVWILYFYSSKLLLAFLEAPSRCTFLWPSSGPGSLLARQRGPELWLLSVPLGPQFPSLGSGCGRDLISGVPLLNSGSWGVQKARTPSSREEKPRGVSPVAQRAQGVTPRPGWSFFSSLGRVAPWAEISLGKAAGALGGDLWLAVITSPRLVSLWLLPLVPQETSPGSGRRTEVVAGASGEMKCHGGQRCAKSRAACRLQDGLAYVCIWKYF